MYQRPAPQITDKYIRVVDVNKLLQNPLPISAENSGNAGAALSHGNMTNQNEYGVPSNQPYHQYTSPNCPSNMAYAPQFFPNQSTQLPHNTLYSNNPEAVTESRQSPAQSTTQQRLAHYQSNQLEQALLMPTALRNIRKYHEAHSTYVNVPQAHGNLNATAQNGSNIARDAVASYYPHRMETTSSTHHRQGSLVHNAQSSDEKIGQGNITNLTPYKSNNAVTSCQEHSRNQEYSKSKAEQNLTEIVDEYNLNAVETDSDRSQSTVQNQSASAVTAEQTFQNETCALLQQMNHTLSYMCELFKMINSSTVQRYKEELEAVRSSNKPENLRKSADQVEQEVKEKSTNCETDTPVPQPPDHDAKWSLKHNVYKPGLVQLIRRTKIYVECAEFELCTKNAKTCKGLAKGMLPVVFSQYALSLCSKRGDWSTLNEFVRDKFLNYVKNYGRARGWKFKLNSVIKSINVKLRKSCN